MQDNDWPANWNKIVCRCGMTIGGWETSKPPGALVLWHGCGQLTTLDPSWPVPDLPPLDVAAWFGEVNHPTYGRIIRHSAHLSAQQEEPMYEFNIVDEDGQAHTYKSSDMRTVLTVHHQVVGTEVVAAIRVRIAD